MLLTLQLFCAFLLGIGFIFLLVDLRTHFGPLFRNFSICLLVMPFVSLLDLISYSEWATPGIQLALQRLMHLSVLPFIVFSVVYLPKLAGRPRPRATKCFAVGALLFLPILFTPAFLAVESGHVKGGPAYAWTFLPYGTCYILFVYLVLIDHLRSAPAGSRKFPALHLLGFATSTVGGFMDMIAVVNSDLYVFPSCKSIGILIFGIFCFYFFAEQFFLVLKERNELFHQVDALNRDFTNARPLQRLGESAAQISHEIKNYVSVLKSNQTLLSGRLRDEARSPEVERMARSTERLEEFVRSLLDYSNCTRMAKRAPIDLGGIISDCVENQFSAHAGVFQVIRGSGNPAVLGERGRLEQVFVNLFKNSLEAQAMRVVVRIEGKEGFARVRIIDDGIGCQPDAAARIGSPFYTTKKSKGGTGLGLAIATSIVEGHGGRLETRSPGSPPNRGFEVSVFLPLHGGQRA